MTPSDLARIAKASTPDGDGCQIWQGACCNGHPCIRIKIDGKWFTKLVRMVLWEHHRGKIPSDSVVTVKCPEPQCVAVEHLVAPPRKAHYKRRRAMTPPTAATKRKMAVFRREHYAKLTNEQVYAIYIGTEPTRAAGAKYGVHHTMVSRIRTGKAWKQYTGLWAGLGGRT